VTRRSLLDPKAADETTVRDLVSRPPRVVFPENTLREAADLMVEDDIGRLPVVTREEPRRVVGFLTRSDLLAAHRGRLKATREASRHLSFGREPSE